MTYVQVLWEEVVKDDTSSASTKYNGSVEAIYTLLSKLSLCLHLSQSFVEIKCFSSILPSHQIRRS